MVNIIINTKDIHHIGNDNYQQKQTIVCNDGKTTNDNDKNKRCNNGNPETRTFMAKIIKLHGERCNKCAVDCDVAIYHVDS